MSPCLHLNGACASACIVSGGWGISHHLFWRSFCQTTPVLGVNFQGAISVTMSNLKLCSNTSSYSSFWTQMHSCSSLSHHHIPEIGNSASRSSRPELVDMILRLFPLHQCRRVHISANLPYLYVACEIHSTLLQSRYTQSAASRAHSGQFPNSPPEDCAISQPLLSILFQVIQRFRSSCFEHVFCI